MLSLRAFASYRSEHVSRSPEQSEGEESRCTKGRLGEAIPINIKGEEIKSDLDSIFNSKSVAVVGVSTKGAKLQFGGLNFVDALLRCDFKGNIYPVNPRGGEILGLKAYPSLKDIPEPVDYVICSIPAPQIPQLIQDCIVKKVKTLHIYTGGFSESGTKKGKQLEEEISSLARQNGIRIIGPNCVGIYCPKSGLSFNGDSPTESGSVAVICQSGSNSNYLVAEGARRGIRFSKFISYGNACDINESDLMEYLAGDQDTKIILAYIEGVKDGRRFSRVLKEAARVKPVIVLKGGIGEAGARAAASHTGALVGADEVWDAILCQAGVIRVYSLEELVDMAVTFSYLPLPSERGVGIVGVGGGATVLATDDCTNAGLLVPRFPIAIQDKLKSYLEKGSLGVGLSNPVDLSDQGWDIFCACTKIMLDYDKIGLLVAHLPAGIWPPKQIPGLFAIVKEIVRAHKESSKPMAVVLGHPVTTTAWHAVLECERQCLENGLPVYHSLSNAAKAIARFLDYHEHRFARGWS